MTHRELVQKVLRDPVHWPAFGFGLGLVPKAPGTFGTIAAIPLYLLLSQLTAPVYLGVVLAAILVGFWCCHQTSKDMGVHDHKAIVWDEFVGFWLTMVAAPPGLGWVLFGFLLFRLFEQSS
mgnify:CR=1 FL=1